MNDTELLFGQEAQGRKEAKFNLFFFQHHLTELINESGLYLREKRLEECFECMTVLFTDTQGFFNDDERTNLMNEWKDTRKLVANFVKEVNNGVQTINNPYFKLIEFRMSLMQMLAKYQLLIQLVNKSQAGAGSNI